MAGVLLVRVEVFENASKRGRTNPREVKIMGGAKKKKLHIFILSIIIKTDPSHHTKHRMSDCDQDNESLDNWKQFQGTELGSLMSQLYGNNRPKINYPKPKVKESFKPSSGFIPGGAGSEASDPRKSTMKRDVKIAKPVFGKQHVASEIIYPVDRIARRRQESVIKSELDEIKSRQAYYRPAFTQPISSEEEKDRLAQICTYKGGKALPSDCVLPVGEAPFEIEAKRRQEELQMKHRMKKSNRQPVKTVYSPTLSPEEELAIQITQEIDERREYIEDMRKTGQLSQQKENLIKAEISQRLLELKRLEA